MGRVLTKPGIKTSPLYVTPSHIRTMSGTVATRDAEMTNKTLLMAE